jgi:hypothetical protein
MAVIVSSTATGAGARVTGERADGIAVARMPLAELTRREVWLRDEGCCVDCGGREQLEFTHALEPQLGRGTAARLQLRCGPCGESRGARL